LAIERHYSYAGLTGITLAATSVVAFPAAACALTFGIRDPRRRRPGPDSAAG
jgi:hypothetical protein